MSAIVIVGLFWLACVPFAYAAFFAELQRRWPELAERDYASDLAISLLFSILGPISLLVTWVGCRGFPRGLKWR